MQALKEKLKFSRVPEMVMSRIIVMDEGITKNNRKIVLRNS